MMNMYPFFGFPYYRRPSPYYANYNSVYNVRRNLTHNLNINDNIERSLKHNLNNNKEYIIERNLKYNNLHNSNSFNVNDVEKTCSPSTSRPKERKNFDNSNFSDFSSKSYVKSNNSNFKSGENTDCANGNNLPYIDSCFEDNYSSNEYFEIFGLKLHFDDLLIICILFFLYQEDVKDIYLYISLILLLLS